MTTTTSNSSTKDSDKLPAEVELQEITTCNALTSLPDIKLQIPNHRGQDVDNERASRSLTRLDSAIDLRTLDNSIAVRSSMTRTPSPTPSELLALTTGAIDWKSLRSRQFWVRKEWRWYYFIFTILLVLVALIAIKRNDIVHFLTPATNWLHDTPAGWLVPVAVLMALSYPPVRTSAQRTSNQDYQTKYSQSLSDMKSSECSVELFGASGSGLGSCKVFPSRYMFPHLFLATYSAAGTLFGEIITFYSFQSCCTKRAKKVEKNTISYACLAKIIREGGFKVALMIRLSIIPPHFATVVFAVCGMNIMVFIVAAFLSLPKQMIIVYLGVALSESTTGDLTTKSKLITAAVLIVGFLIAIATMVYVFRQMDKAKPAVVYERRKARQKMVEQGAGVLRRGEV
ncbi:hypothetical protein D9758_004472 [Tetrapyrgos nigripes]|uniref:Golgi apparatus membrane protein TVP38 n=1 Tax=Tetrapyrgos nigripes TaxID=182062 RepID=A0A8H5GN31_9AGAR|nr:hypothetical protein D9758_004472 [Tetrapyrgos nigripes]